MSGKTQTVPLAPRSFLPPQRPSDVLSARFNALGKVSQAALGEALGVSRLSANELLNGRRSITAVMALRLARIFDSTPEFWMDLQRDWDLWEAEAEHGREIAALPKLRVAQRREDMERPIGEIAAEMRSRLPRR